MDGTIRVSRRAAERLRAGHLWVYRSDVDGYGAGRQKAEEQGMAEPGPGALVTVADGRGALLGTALWSTASKIAARLVSREPGLDRARYLADVRLRVAEAVALRAALAPSTENDNAHRLLFSEADGLPGIVADRYSDLVLVQLLTQGTAQPDVRLALREALALAFHSVPTLTVWERPDPRIAALEQLEAPPPGALLTLRDDGAHATTEFRLNGLRFGYDAAAGQKTGAFLDQRLNYEAAAKWAERLLRAAGRPGRALDICTYQGGFALHLARACARVTGVDASRSALEIADRNLLLNPELAGCEVDWLEADAFELLRSLDQAAHPSSRTALGGSATGGVPADLQGRFDVIVLDPPAFAKSARAAEGALRGYKELNLRALRLLAPGGLLVTCSCSHHVDAEAFHEVVRGAASDAGRSLQVLESRGAAPDHPEVLALPETRYLKCLICRVD